MASKKRGATSELNHENWNVEEGPEEAGTFKRASEDIIKTRVIKTAKRRNPISSPSSEDNKKSIFGGFTGFSKPPAATNVTNAFGFLSNLKPTAEQSKSNGTAAASPQKQDSVMSSKATQEKTTKEKGSSEDYYAKLKGLNESVTKWIKQHVDENPFINLQPIFKDYEKYYEELERNHRNCDSTISLISESDLNPIETVDNGNTGFKSFVFQPTDKVSSSNEPKEKKPAFSFGVSSTSKPSTSLKGVPDSSKTNAEALKFSFGSSGTDSIKSSATVPKFSFGDPNASKPESKASTEAPKFSFGTTAAQKEPNEADKPASDKPKFSFGISPADKTESLKKPIESKLTSGSPATKEVPSSSESNKPMFSFGSSNVSSTTFKFDASKTFSFGASATSTSSSSGFSFPKPSTSSALSFSNPQQASSTEEQQNEDEEEPPKPEFTPVVEEGHVYTTRCKVFVKKDKEFGDRGVGNLYLKPVPDSEKMQLIVRADTNLGNLLCNFILSESIPTQRIGKKDVMLVCVPSPEAQPPPVPILLRVKSPEEADELLKTLEKYKK